MLPTAHGNVPAVSALRKSSSATGINGDQADNSLFEAGAAYVFTRDAGGVWTQDLYVKGPAIDAEDEFGSGIDVFGDGGTIAVGARREDSASVGINNDDTDNSALGAGAVYVYQ